MKASTTSDKCNWAKNAFTYFRSTNAVLDLETSSLRERILHPAGSTFYEFCWSLVQRVKWHLDQSNADFWKIFINLSVAQDTRRSSNLEKTLGGWVAKMGIPTHEASNPRQSQLVPALECGKASKRGPILKLSDKQKMVTEVANKNNGHVSMQIRWFIRALCIVRASKTSPGTS